MDLIKAAENTFAAAKEYPAFKAGDTVTVHYKIVEGNKERIQQFRGVVLQKKGTGSGATFTVRKMSGNIGVERIFPVFFTFYRYHRSKQAGPGSPGKDILPAWIDR